MIHYHNYNEIRPNQIEDTAYTRGIAFVEPNYIAIGTSSGSILLFDIPTKGNNIVVKNKILDKNLNSGMTDLISDEHILFGSDSNGNIVGWNIKSIDNPKNFLYINSNSK